MKNIANHRDGRPLHILQEKKSSTEMFEKQDQCSCYVDHIISHFFIELKNLPSFFIYHTHDDFNIADPSSMKDACHT